MDIRFNPRRRQAAFFVQCIMSLLIVAIGVIVCINLYRVCKKCLNPPPQGPPTNGVPPNPTLLSLGEPYQYSSAWIPIGFSPDVATNDCDCGCAFVIQYQITSNQCAITAAWKPVITTETNNAYLLTNYGLADNFDSASYNTNQVPIGFEDGYAYIGDQITGFAVVERSTNLVNWTPIMTNSVEPGYTYQFMDATAPCNGSAFYRVEHISIP